MINFTKFKGPTVMIKHFMEEKGYVLFHGDGVWILENFIFIEKRLALDY